MPSTELLPFIWIKTTKTAKVVKLNGDGLLTEVKGSGVNWGMGFDTRANSEFVLLATRGSPQRMATDVHQVVMAPVGEHSEKPDEVYRRIEQLYNGPYLELFARKPRTGMDSLGQRNRSRKRGSGVNSLKVPTGRSGLCANN